MPSNDFEEPVPDWTVPEWTDVSLPDADPEADTLPSTGLLSFYDRLRGRIVNAVERRGGNLGGKAADLLLLVPDVFILLARLALDERVPKRTRALLASALAYFILPADFLPEILLGPGGYLDDLLLGVAVLYQVFGRELEPYAEEYWSGPEGLRQVLGDVLTAAHGLLGSNLYDRLRRLLAKQGVDLDAVPDESP